MPNCRISKLKHLCTFQKAVDHLIDVIQERRASMGQKEHKVTEDSEACRVRAPIEVRGRQITSALTSAYDISMVIVSYVNTW